jgi:hypothetical protein
MNTIHLTYILQSDPCTTLQFGGVFAKDQFPATTTGALPRCYIVNSEPSSSPGAHWLAMWFPHGSDKAEFFDSYGRAPDPAFAAMMRSHGHSTFRYNTTRLQGVSTACGQYCLMYLLCRSRGISLDDFVDMFDVNDYAYNDSMVVMFCNKHFAIDTSVVDARFVINVAVNQSAR